MKWYLKALKQYADFKGRARRQEYWMFVLFNILFGFAAGIVDSILGTSDPQTGGGVIAGLYALVMLVPGIAVTVRRLHDIGKSGWFVLVVFIPLIGVIWLIVMAVTEGNPGDNEYGTDPKLEVV